MLNTIKSLQAGVFFVGGRAGPRDDVGPHALRAWLSARADSYSRVVAALGLTVPFLVLALARYLDETRLMSLAGLYAVLVFLGYYMLVLWVLVTFVFVIASFSTRAAVLASGTLLTAALFYLVLDATLYRVYRFHVDAFWLEYMLTSFNGIGISWSLLGVGGIVLVCAASLEWFLFAVARRLPNRRRFVVGVIAATGVAFAASQALHVVAYERNDPRLTHITFRLPFYYPITSHRNATKYASLLPMIAESAAPGFEDASRPLAYPLRDPQGSASVKRRTNIVMLVLESWRFDTMNEVVSPNIHAFSLKSSVFDNHFSSGNSTPSGIFSLFYGIHPTYWTAVKANNAAIDNPVLIDVLKANGYAFGIFADSHFQRHKIKDAMFRGIEVHESFAGSTADTKDRDLTDQLLAFIGDQQAAGTPFFGFAFYKSSHFSYYYPKESARFTPAHKLNIALAGPDRDPTLFLNDYRNAVSYIDGLVGDLLTQLEASGVLDNTIVIITSDHGEEFNDNRANYWGHTSNFTGFQTRVPLVVYVPWEKPRRVTEVTAHVDIPPTILEQGLGCGENVDDYSNGRNLFGPLGPERPVVIGSYINHAVVMGDDVYSVYPMYVQKYKLWNVKEKAGAVRADLARQAMEEMHRFYGGTTTARR